MVFDAMIGLRWLRYELGRILRVNWMAHSIGKGSSKVFKALKQAEDDLVGCGE